MGKAYNIYCDESCHLEKDHQPVMVIGAIWCQFEQVPTISKEIRNIKEKHSISKSFEFKWVKISPSRMEFYLDLVNYFFSNPELMFRVLIIPDKTKLNHSFFKQTHDEWYYKMFFELLKFIMTSQNRYRVFIDIKDTHSGERMRKLHEVLSNNLHDFDHHIIENVQAIRSHESEILQLTDLLIGAVCYDNRNLATSNAKRAIVSLIREKTNRNLRNTTPSLETKFNIFRWTASETK